MLADIIGMDIKIGTELLNFVSDLPRAEVDLAGPFLEQVDKKEFITFMKENGGVNEDTLKGFVLDKFGDQLGDLLGDAFGDGVKVTIDK